MVVKSYEQMTDVSIMEVKTYLLIHSDGIYQQDIYDLMNTCIDVFQLKRKLNKRKDIQKVQKLVRLIFHIQQKRCNIAFFV